MDVAILGAGGIGLGTAAFLAGAGHGVRLWAPSLAGGKAGLPAGGIKADGVLAGSFPATVTRTPAEAIAGAGAVIVAVPGNGQKAVADLVAAHLSPGQPVIISGELSLAALYLARKLAARNVSAPVIAWATTVTTGRRSAPGTVNISTVRKQLDVATVPASDNANGLAACRALFGDRFTVKPDLLAITFSNLNPPTHLANSLCNLTRMERGEKWSNYAGISPAVGRLIEALDRERIALARAFGLEVRTIHDHMHLSFDLPRGTVGEMAAEQNRRRGGNPAGPTTIDHRYITEDVPFGLLPLTTIGRIAGVPMPLHEAGIAMMSALLGRDFAAENDLLPELGVAGLSAAALHDLARRGPTAGGGAA